MLQIPLLLPPQINIPVPDVEEIRQKFIPPIRIIESTVVSFFIRSFPDLTSVFNYPFLKIIPGYSSLVKHIDSVGIITVIVSITLTCLFAVGLFFITIAALQGTFFLLQCITGSIAILSTGAYVKRYYLLRRIQQEVNILEKYSGALETHIHGLEDNLTRMNDSVDILSKTSKDLKKENDTYNLLNTDLQSSLSDMKKTAGEFHIENTLLRNLVTQQGAENSRLTASNTDLEDTAELLRRTVTGAEESYKNLDQEFEKFRKANVVLAHCIALADDQQKKLGEIVKEGANIKVENEKTKALLDQYKTDLSQIREFLEREKNELQEVTNQLKEASNSLTGLQGEILV